MRVPHEKQVLDDIGHAPGQAKSLRSLHALYGLKGRERVGFRRMLESLVEQGRLVRLRGPALYGLPRARKRLTGRLTVTSKGFGFVAIDDPAKRDVFVAERDLKGALSGDQVEVALTAGSRSDRPAGEVVALVRRRDVRLVGLFREGAAGAAHRLEPFDPHVAAPIVIPDRFAHGAEDGVFVEVRLLREHHEHVSEDGVLTARVVAVLGAPDEPGTDVRVILRSFHLADAHSPEAVGEAERRAARGIEAADLQGRRDLRALRTVTIDGETARDFDDAVSIERRPDGFRLFVHIADVAAHVEEGTALDAEAQERATSVYFPDRAVHMLPEALSAGACSLRPGEDRLSMTAILDFDSRGELRSTDLCNSWIRSDRRMTYTEMKRLLVDREPALAVELGELVADLELMGRLAELLVERREERGGLDFDLPTPLVKVDEDGLPTEIVESERNAAHRLIEEFMIAANQAVARFLDGRREPSVYRNHEPPPADKVAAFREAAKVFGHDLRGGEAPDPKAFQRVLGSAAGRPEEHLLTMLALRTMSQARYETGNGGHFGLALGHYTHFTSPIRRYPDLVVHRALKRVLAGESTPEDERDDVTAGLAEVAAHCSKAERNAEAAERALIEWKKCVFMVDKLGQRFEGRITGIAEFGVFVALVEHHVEGLVRLSALRDDYYERDATGLRLVGRRTRRTLRLGDPLRVRVAEVDVFHRRIGLEEA